jgi:hypothetical protein
LSYLELTECSKIHGAGRDVVPSVTCEYVWSRLIARGSLGSRATARAVRVGDLAQAAQDEMFAETRPRDLEPGRDVSGLEDSVHRRFSLHQLWVYDPVIVDFELRRLPYLFRPVDGSLREALGVGLKEIGRLVGAFDAHLSGWMLERAGIHEAPEGVADTVRLLRDAVAAGACEFVEPGMARALAMPEGALAADAGVGASAAAAFLELLATCSTAPRAARFETEVWRLRSRPIMVWSGRVMVPAPHSLSVAVRPALEAGLRARAPAVGVRYDAHRAAWLESEALRVLSAELLPDQAYRNLRIGADRSDTPERDGLLRLDMCAIAMEAKAGGVSLSARRGRAASQDQTIRRLIREGVEQADDLLAATRDGRPINGISLATNQREDVRLGFVDRYVPLVVTLEDMGGVVGASRTLFPTRPADAPLPMVVSIDDLVWYSREVRLPAQLLHYFSVRERIARSSARLVVWDEADWFTFYLSRGGAGVQEWLDASDEIDVQLLARGHDARRGLPLDNLAIWRTPHEEALRRWQHERRDGWLEASLAMLDLSSEQSDRLLAILADAQQLSQRTTGVGQISLRPAGNREVAVHVLVPHTDTAPIELQHVGSWLSDQIPEVDTHVLLGARAHEPGRVEFVGVITATRTSEPA